MNRNLLFVFSFFFLVSCGTATALQGARLMLTPLIQKAFEWVEDNIMQERGAVDYLANYDVGDTMSEKDSKALLQEFRKNGFGDDKCGLYICKDSEVPCNPKESDCDCKCEIELNN